MRPFAVEYHRGKVYVGMVCSAESSNAATDLKAYLYAVNPATLAFGTAPLFQMNLNYPRGKAASTGPADWLPWKSTYTNVNTNPTTRLLYPMPMFTNIAFDNGDLIIGLRDRIGDIAGSQSKDNPATQDLYQGRIAGDILRAAGSPETGWILEDNGRSEGNGTAVQNTGQGPGATGAEFYHGDSYPISTSGVVSGVITGTTGIGVNHDDVSLGTMTQIPGFVEVAAVVYDPTLDNEGDGFFDGGVRWLNNITGAWAQSYRIYNGVSTGTTPGAADFGKAAGLGELIPFCDLPPIQIGNRVWRDTNDNGVQDAGEPALAGVIIQLKGPGVPANTSVTTGTNGEYYFSNGTGTNATGFVYGLTGLTNGGSYSLCFPLTSNALMLSSKANSASGTNADAIDSDASATGVISFVLGQAGQNNFTYDAGYKSAPPCVDNLLLNPSFEQGFNNPSTQTFLTPPPSWTGGNSEVNPGASFDPADGIAFAFTLQNSPTMCQSVSATPGSSFTLTFFAGVHQVNGQTVRLEFLNGTTPIGTPQNFSITHLLSTDFFGGPYTLQSGIAPAGTTALRVCAVGNAAIGGVNGYAKIDNLCLRGIIPAPCSLSVTVNTPVCNTATNQYVATGAISLTNNISGATATITDGARNMTVSIPAGASSVAYSLTGLVSGTGSHTLVVNLPGCGSAIATYTAPAPCLPSSLGDKVFIDNNRNGIQDLGSGGADMPLGGVTVILYINGVASATTTTASSGTGIGCYSFTGLTPGNSNSYAVGFTTPAQYTITTPNAPGSTSATDSDVIPATGRTLSITLAAGENNPTLDAGYVPCSVSLALTIQPSATICGAGSITLSASANGANSYTLLNPNTVNTSGLFPLSPTGTTTYTVVTSLANSCSAQNSITLTVNPPPVAALTSATICRGETVTLTASGGSGQLGTLYNFGSGNSANGTLVVSPTSTTTYSVVVSNASGCTAMASGTVVVNLLPVAALSSATICSGNSATLTASVGTLYNFGSGNSATATRVVSPTATTTYSVTVTNASGCSAMATSTVTVNPLPVAALSSATICRGETVTLTASGGTLYNFGSGNAPTGVLVVNPTTTTTYTVTVTNANGCTAIGSGIVTVNPLPVAALSSATICRGNSATLTASGGVLYNFGNGNQAGNTLVVNPANTTTYSVLVTNASGCTALANGTVTVNQPPVATLSSATICRGQSATLTASGGTLYNFGSGNSATGTLIVSPTDNTPYNVVVTDAKGCTAMAMGTVTVNLLPTATLTSATICAGNSATLTAGGGTSYTLLNTNTSNTTGLFAVSPSTTTTYTVVAMNAQGCTASANSLIVVNLLPALTLSSATICEGESATLTASVGGTGGPFTYKFSGSINNSTGILIVNPSATTTYSVVVTNANGCTASAMGTVTVNAVPVLVIVPANQVVCLGNGTTLTVTNCTGNLRWSTGETNATITITPILNTTYTVTCTTPQGCTTAARSEVTVSQPGSVSVTDNAPLCAGATLQLATGESGTTYSWSGPNGFTANTATVSVSNVSAANAGVYSVTVTGGACSGIGSTTVTLNPAVTASLSSASICQGQSVTLIASGGGAGSGPFSYEFSGSITNNTGRFVVNPSGTTTYSVLVTNAQGCTGMASGTVTLNPAVTASYSSATICAGESATLIASGGTLYNFGSGNTTSNLLIVNPMTTTTYNVVVSNGFGCTALATARVMVNPLPIATLSSATICAGASQTLIASGGNVGGPFAYTFSDGTANTTGVLSVTPSGTTTYSVIVRSTDGCMATASGTVTVNPLPIATLTSATICEGESATLTASGGNFYNFGNGSSTTNSLVVSPILTRSYSVLVTNVGGCQATATASVTVNPVPVATLTGATICTGESVTLTASGGLTGSFSYTLIETGAVNTTGSFPLSPTATTPYTVRVANNAGCTAQATNTVTVNPLPMAALTNSTICVGESTTLTATGGAGLPGALYNFGSGNSPDAALIVSPSMTTTYSVVVSNGNGCTALARGTVMVNPSPVVTFASATICAGESTTLLASVTGNQGGILFNFGSGNSTSGSLIVNPTTTSSYSVVVTNTNDCTALARATVTVNPLPSVGITSVSCVGLTTYSVNFTATAGASISVSAGTLAGNQVTGIPSDQAVLLTATLLGCTATDEATQNCNLNAASLGDFVFEDINRNGIQDAGDLPISGATVTLLQNGSAIATTTTSVSGLYGFTGLTPSIPYSVSFTTPSGFTASTLANVGDDALDSDAVNGLTGSYTLTAGENNPTVDAGFVRPVVQPSFDLIKLVSNTKAKLGEVISYTVILVNSGPVAATSVMVSDSFTAGLSIVPGSISVSTGSFTPDSQGGTWAIASLPVGTTATLIYSASIIAEGIIYNTATIPGDEAKVCLSVPFKVCTGSDYAIEVVAPSGFTRYQWLYTAPGSTSATIVADGTLNSYTATKAGEYKLVADDGITGLCAQPSCCPVYIEEMFVPAYTAVAGNPTCIGTTPQANGQIKLLNLGTDLTEYFYQVSPGSSFSASTAVPASPTPVPADGVVSTSLAAGTYTVRVWVLLEGQPSCPRDVTVVVPPADCACPAEICVPVTIRKSKRVTE